MKENKVMLYGEIMGRDNEAYKPKIKTDEANKAVRYQMMLRTIKRMNTDKGNNAVPRYQYPTIRTENEEMIKQLSAYKAGDIIQITKGVLCAVNVRKASVCPVCGKRNERIGLSMYVEPIFVERREGNVPEEQVLGYLTSHSEISNCVSVMGHVASDPHEHFSMEGLRSVQTPLVIKRKYRIKNDSPDKTEDYFMLKSYGNQAQNDLDHLLKGSGVYVDGFIQTRTFTKIEVCGECLQEYETEDRATEVVPYSVEYLSHYRSIKTGEIVRPNSARDEEEDDF